MKVFKQQLVESKVAFTSLFIGTFANALPYANALLMIIKEVSKALADMFGIKLSDYNSGIASQEDAYLDLEDSIDGATDAVKELKRQTLGFDEIHNINENKDNGNGGDLTGGIDQRLLDAIEGYDNGMSKVRMKATEIRDRIMEWLGFTKEIDPLTGEVGFKYQGMKVTLKNIWDSFKGLSTEGKILVGLGLVAGATKLWGTGKKLVTVFGNTGLLKVIKSLYKPTTSLFSDMLSGLKGSHTTLKSGIQSWREQMGIIDSTTGKVDGFKGVLNGAKTAMSGLITAGLGLYSVHESMKSISNEGFNLANSLGLVGGSLGAIAGGVQIGAVFGGWGPVIGGAVGALASLIFALDGYDTASEKSAKATLEALKPIAEYNDSLQSQFEQIEKNYSQQLLMTEVHEALLSELQEIVDANGRVKAGYEERANFIISELNKAYGTEIKMVDRNIQGYEQQIQKITELIRKKQEEIATNTALEKYEIAIKEQSNAYSNLMTANEKYSEAQQNVIDREKELEKQFNKSGLAFRAQFGTIETYIGYCREHDKSLKSLIKAEEDAQKKLEDSKKSYSETQEAIAIYNGIITATTQSNSEMIEYYTAKLLSSHEQEIESYTKLIEEAKASYDEQIRIAKESGIEITDAVISQAETRYREHASILAQEVKSVEDVTPDYVNAWGLLASNSEKTFLTYFQKLDKDIQQEVVDKMYDQGYNISSELQKGIEENNLEIHIKSKVDKATLQLDADFSQATTKANNWLSNTVDRIKSAISSITGNNAKETGGAFYNGGWHDIKQYANGGAPSHGTLFWAGEHGAEVVAHANGRTEVLNQSQIASAIYSAVYSAMSQFNGGGVAEINVHASKDVIVETAINGINQTTKQTGSCPINIPTN